MGLRGHEGRGWSLPGASNVSVTPSREAPSCRILPPPPPNGWIAEKRPSQAVCPAQQAQPWESSQPGGRAPPRVGPWSFSGSLFLVQRGPDKGKTTHPLSRSCWGAEKLSVAWCFRVHCGTTRPVPGDRHPPPDTEDVSAPLAQARRFLLRSHTPARAQALPLRTGCPGGCHSLEPAAACLSGPHPRETGCTRPITRPCRSQAARVRVLGLCPVCALTRGPGGCGTSAGQRPWLQGAPAPGGCDVSSAAGGPGRGAAPKPGGAGGV